MIGTFSKPAKLTGITGNADRDDSQNMWDDVRDESPVRSNGQHQIRSSVGMNEEYVDWLETNNIKHDKSQDVLRKSIV